MAGVDSCLFKITVEGKVVTVSRDERDKHRRRKHILKNVGHHKNEFSSDSEIEGKSTRERRRIRRVIERVNPNAPRLTQLIAPRFNKPLDDCAVMAGEKGVMMVATQGDPPPDCEIRHEPTNQHYLILKNPDQNEEAEYACH
ncbi:unnamed protein product, partial [Strongylus vulgaris]